MPEQWKPDQLVHPTATMGRLKLAEYQRLRAELRRWEEEAMAMPRRFQGWQPLEDKDAIWQCRNQIEKLKAELGTVAAEIVVTLTEAMQTSDERAAAQEALADYYWERFLEAEASLDVSEQQYFGDLVSAYHEGKYSYEIKGDGTLSLTSDPQGAEVLLYRYEKAGFMLEPRHERHLGRTPLGPIQLPMGSYLAIIRHEGYRDVRYPIFISRNRDWEGSVRLYTDKEIGNGFKYIPAGRFLEGGDPETRGWGLPLQSPWVDDFLLAEHPVLSSEYLEFINDIARRDREEAIRRSPRLYPERGSYLIETEEGRFELPPPGEDGEVWHPRIPVFGISWHDAMAYCAWRSERDGREYRLPAEREWEKAARGVDGRWYPWGNEFDPCLCNMRDSRLQGPGPVSVDDFPTDVSVYGVRGLAGNVRDWTATHVVEEVDESYLLARGSIHHMVPSFGYERWRKLHDARVVRGGAWSPIIPRLADRFWLVPDLVLSFLGFRLARTPPGANG